MKLAPAIVDQPNCVTHGLGFVMTKRINPSSMMDNYYEKVSQRPQSSNFSHGTKTTRPLTAKTTGAYYNKRATTIKSSQQLLVDIKPKANNKSGFTNIVQRRMTAREQIYLLKNDPMQQNFLESENKIKFHRI